MFAGFVRYGKRGSIDIHGIEFKFNIFKGICRYMISFFLEHIKPKGVELIRIN